MIRQQRKTKCSNYSDATHCTRVNLQINSKQIENLNYHVNMNELTDYTNIDFKTWRRAPMPFLSDWCVRYNQTESLTPRHCIELHSKIENTSQKDWFNHINMLNKKESDLADMEEALYWSLLSISKAEELISMSNNSASFHDWWMMEQEHLWKWITKEQTTLSILKKIIRSIWVITSSLPTWR